MSGVHHIEVSSDEEGMRLDRWFRSHFPDVSQGQLQKLLRKGDIRVDGARAKANVHVVGGQSVRIPPLNMSPKSDKEKQSNKPKVSEQDRKYMNDMVIYRDHHVIVLNKPSGLAVQGGTGTKVHVDGLLPALVEEGAEKPRLVHRIDKDTSGILVLAATAKAARLLTEAFRGKEVRKLYWALVENAPRPAKGKVDMALSKAMTETRAGGREQMIVDEEDGKWAVTLYETLEKAGQKLAWVSLYPQTGRTHQLRVHMAEIGSPIIGDGKYGNRDAAEDDEGRPSGFDVLSERLHLHARGVSIPNPSGGVLDIVAPLTGHMKKTWKSLGFNENEYPGVPNWPEF